MVGLDRTQLSWWDRWWIRVALIALRAMSNAAAEDFYDKLTDGYFPRWRIP